MVSRFLLSSDATGASSKSDESRVMPDPAKLGPAERAGTPAGKRVFAEAMLEDSPTRPARRLRDFAVSAAVQVILVAALVLIPLYFTDAIDLHQFNRALLVAPPAAAAPPPPPAPARPLAPKHKLVSLSAKLSLPRVIPNHVALTAQEPAGADLTAAIEPGDGIPGGIPGGQPGGVIGGIGGNPSAPTPPSPVNSAPKSPLRVGGKVKAPRLVFGPDPVYPLLARQAKIAGAVVIDAVIDTNGNVIGMRTVSGQAILALAAMEALRHWKYEPTFLGGEPIPVELLVTITFERKGPRA